MKRSIILGLWLALLLAVSPTHAVQQGGGSDDGSLPVALNPGDSNRPGSYGGSAFLELRDIPTTEGGSLSIFGARSLRVTARIDDGESFRIIDGNFVCGDNGAPADPCSVETVCTIRKGNRESCEEETVVDIQKGVEIQAVVVWLVARGIVDKFGLVGTVLELAKVKEYAQDGPLEDADGVFSFVAVFDLAYSEQ